jgi:hypothetical protein
MTYAKSQISPVVKYVDSAGEYLDMGGKKWRRAEKDFKMRSFVNCTLHQILLG